MDRELGFPVQEVTWQKGLSSNSSSIICGQNCLGPDDSISLFLVPPAELGWRVISPWAVLIKDLGTKGSEYKGLCEVGSS